MVSAFGVIGEDELMDAGPGAPKKSGWGWIWWGLALPLVVVVAGGLLVEYLKPGQGAKASGERTHQYWCDTNLVQQRQARAFATQGKGTREEVVPLLTAVAESVEALSSQGVDADAIEVAYGLAESARRLASFLERTAGPGDEAFATVDALLLGDAGAFKDHAADAREVRTFIEEAAAKARKVRALLMSRYDREFPAMEAAVATAKQPRPPGGPDRVVFHFYKDLTVPPPEVEAERLRREEAQLDREIKKAVEVSAEADVAYRALRTGTDAQRAALEGSREEVAALDEAVKEAKKLGDKPVNYKGNAVSVKDAGAILASKVEALKRSEEDLKNKEKLLQAKQEARDVAARRVETMRAQQQELRAAREQIEVELQKLRLQGGDDGAYEKSTEKLEEIRRRLESGRKELDLMGIPR